MANVLEDLEDTAFLFLDSTSFQQNTLFRTDRQACFVGSRLFGYGLLVMVILTSTYPCASRGMLQVSRTNTDPWPDLSPRLSLDSVDPLSATWLHQ